MDSGTHQRPSHSAPVPRASGRDRGRTFALVTIGLFLGAAIDHEVWGAVSGAGLGWLIAAWQTAKRNGELLVEHVTHVSEQVEDLERRLRTTTAASSESAAPTATAAESTDGASGEIPPRRIERDEAKVPAPLARRRRKNPLELAAAMIRGFFFGGNTVVRVGILVLLVGVALLAKWAADHSLFPIEARLAGGAGIGIALTAVGYRLRASRAGFATTLQGGGVAALYLVVFSAYRIFDLIPAEMAFGLSVVIAAAAAILAVLQRSQPLIFIGTAGGFMAPLLASSGEGNHVVLFGYYLILNCGVASVAWFRAWRALNLLAFVSTYGVATAWGVLKYEPENFATTQFFVIAFLLLFTFEALFFSWRRTPRLRGMVDGTLVFGTPLVTLIAQAHLVRDIEFGLAYSAAGLALFYSVVATWLWRTAPETLRRMAEAFIALALGFATMAIPFAFEGSMTVAVAWSLEGAGIYWVGSRQSRRLARFAGVALQGLSAAAFIISALGFGNGISDPQWAILNGRYLSCLALAVAGAFIAREAYRNHALLSRRERSLTQVLGAWGLLWWVVGATIEVENFVQWEHRYATLVLVAGATGVALEGAAAKIGWRPGRFLALAVLPLGFILFLMGFDNSVQMLENTTLLAWPLTLASVYFVLNRLEAVPVRLDHASSGSGEKGVERWLPYAYAPALWLVGLVVSAGLAMIAEHRLGLVHSWPMAAKGLGLAIVVFGFTELSKRGFSMFERHPGVQFSVGVGPVTLIMLAWAQIANATASGAAGALPYVPVLNPIDLSILIAYVAGAAVWLRGREHVAVLRSREGKKIAAAGIAGVAFMWLNGILARSVHHWADVPFGWGPLWDSVPLQVCFSIAWTLVALAGMWTSTRQAWRIPWIACASLVGVVVLKLFIVDLSQLGTGTKIVTFLVVGILLLVVGFVSPVPPDSADSTDSTATPDSPGGGDAGPGESGHDGTAVGGYGTPPSARAMSAKGSV